MATYGSPTTGAEYPRFDYDGTGKLIYHGVSAPRAATSEPLWQIRKFEYDGSGNLTAVKYATGYKDFTQIWDNRAALTYL